VRRAIEEGTWLKTTGRRRGKMRDNGLALWWEADVERRGTHGKRRVDDEKEGGPRGPKRGGGWMTHDSRRKVERKMT
jgi:hypothetical protein